MKNKRKLYSIALASAVLIFTFSVLISPFASAVQVTKIGSGSDPAIHGSKVVWTNGGVIHIYDLTTKKDTTVSSSAASYPAIYGNKLVWHDESSGKPRLAVYDISTTAKTYITQNVDKSSRPAIYGSRIVWSADYNETSYNYNVYMRDISTSTQTKIAEGNSPDIYDTKITYGYEDSDGRNIAVYDVNTKETIKVHHSSQVFSPHIYGNKVIWSDFYNRDGYIQMYDLVTKKTMDVTSDNTGNTLRSDAVDAGADTGTHININGNKIVYAKTATDQFGSAGVYVYSISSGRNTQIANYENGVLTTPDVYDNIIVWGINDNYGTGKAKDNGIYMSDLSAINTMLPVAAFTSNVTSGTAPLVVLFTETGTGGVPTSWLWDFGDGIHSKHAMNATHTFTKPGTYNVTLTVTNAAGSNSVTRPGYITVTAGSPAEKPVADFYSPEAEKVLSENNSNGIYENEVVSFFDKSTGSPTAWEWDFGDGNTSTQRNPTHVYGKIGGYTVTLTVRNAAGSDTISKYGYVLMGIRDADASPAYFSSDLTSGYAPLTVTFVDDKDAELPNYPIWRQWDFGDGVIQTYMVDNNPSATPYAMHTYEKPGKYSVTLYLDNRGGKSIITKHNYITVKDPNIADLEIPIANFNSNVTWGYAPLAVQFNDLSQNAVSRTWDFNNDGKTDSSDLNPVYVYTAPGTYFINLKINNAYGFSSKITTITVLEGSSSGGSKSGSSSSRGSGGGGGSPEPAKNVEVKELSQAFIINGKSVKFDFIKNATCVVYLTFDAKRTFGKTTTVAEQLKGKSALVSELPSEEVYKSFNIWIGNGGIATSKNIENPTVCFKVDKSWIKDKKIDPASITLNKYSEKKWGQLVVNLSREDDKFLYFTAETPESSSFVITGKTKSPGDENKTGEKPELETRATNGTNAGIEGLDAGLKTNPEESKSTPGFEIVYGLAGLFAVFLYGRKQIQG